MVEIEAELSEVSRMNNKARWAERMERSEENFRSKLFQYSVANAAPPKHKVGLCA